MLHENMFYIKKIRNTFALTSNYSTTLLTHLFTCKHVLRTVKIRAILQLTILRKRKTCVISRGSLIEVMHTLKTPYRILEKYVKSTI